MKKRELVELMKKAAEELAQIAPGSYVIVHGRKVPVHRIAHGAAAALGTAALAAGKPSGGVTTEKIIGWAIDAALDWEADHGCLGGEDGADE